MKMKHTHWARSIAFLAGIALAAVAQSAPAAADDLGHVVCDKCVGTSDIAKKAITTSRLKNNAVKTNKIKDGAVNSAKVLDGSLSGVDILDNSLFQADLGANSVGASEIATNAVGASEIATNAVGASEIAAGAVGQSEIATSGVATAEVLNNNLLDIDLRDEAGGEFSGSGHSTALSATDTIIRSIVVSKPTSGIVIVWASGMWTFSGLGHDSARCSITSGSTVLDFNALMQGSDHTGDLFGPSHFMPFSGTRGFSFIFSGSTTFRLICDEQSGSASVQDTQLTAIFLPTRY